ncbi:MAG TPA: hypothetical protein VGN82_04865 [Bosea sp. (in: a-proteobacteria)]|jgi:hypothetical protein|uniref:hypothetical protein n=1 Tax=Bosea sp. (in: a-proteobacteria) TaxID=1871050 RepID=UPI002E0E7801|nr:hypothetical protein [Bosea sp. (in: a-proteobacteria)]
MPPPTAKGPAFEIKSRIVHANTVVVPKGRYAIKPPKGLTASDLRLPKFVRREDMMKLLSGTQKNNPGQLASVHGLVTAEFAVAFPDIDKQWLRSVGPQNRVTWRFQGGEVVLEVTISVHVLEDDRPLDKDRLSQKLFAVIWEHELLHVLDDIEIVRDWLPGQVREDEWSRKYLIGAQELPDSTFEHYIRKDNLTVWFRDGPWLTERNRRAGIRDSAANYAHVSDEINTIRSQMTNR